MTLKTRNIYNLEFPSYCQELNIFGYRFKRVLDYKEKFLSLQHLITSHYEFSVQANNGGHAITATVEIPPTEEKAVLPWENKSAKALQDILLLLSIFTERDVFYVTGDGVIIADPRVHPLGGVLRCSIPYKKRQLDQYHSFDIGFEEGMNKVYDLLRSEDWLRKYDNGHFLIVLNQAFKKQSIETSFILCWSVWEQLFALHNRLWLSEDQIRNMPAKEKIAFILVQYALRPEVKENNKKRIAELARIRNSVVHYGRFPVSKSIEDVVFFIRLTEFVIAKVLGLLPSNVFNTIERLEAFMKKRLTKS